MQVWLQSADLSSQDHDFDCEATIELFQQHDWQAEATNMVQAFFESRWELLA